MDDIVAESLIDFKTILIAILAFLGIFALAMLLLNSFLSTYEEVYPILIPKYFDEWYELLWLDNIDKAAAHYSNQNTYEYETYWKITDYRSELRSLLLNFIHIPIVWFSTLYHIFQRMKICDLGIYDKNSKFKLSWGEIKNYSWDGPYSTFSDVKYVLKLWDGPEVGKPKMKIPLSGDNKMKINAYLEEKINGQ